MPSTLIATVLNEEKTVDTFIHSILSQSKKTDEIIIVDGGSRDNTVKKLSSYDGVTVYTKKGNRSVGRNYAIKKAKNDIILCSDSGCVLDKKWVENMLLPFQDETVDVVAGYYKGKAETVFQKCLIPYALVMPDKVNPATFLPASRSMAFRKSIWKKIGGFPKEYSHNEDYVFAKSLKKIKAHIVFKKNAIVYWIPRRTMKEAFIMFYRFAYGDAEAKMYRGKVVFVFLRYIIGFLLFVLGTTTVKLLLCSGFVIYLLWSISKNYRYVKHSAAFFYLPSLQIISDIAVIVGTMFGLARIRKVSLS